MIATQRNVIRKKRRGPARRGRVHDRAYLAWIATHECIICIFKAIRGFGNGTQTSRTEVAHVGTRGLGQKSSDRETLPVCGVEHHRLGKESLHMLGRRFWAHWRLDRDGLIREYNARYEREMAA